MDYDAITAYSIATSTASVCLVVALIIQAVYTWKQAATNADTELGTLIDEVTTTRAALDPLERYVREGNLDQRSRKIIIVMMTNLSVMEDQLFTELEAYLGVGGKVT